MLGQHLAVESVITFAMGLVLALGVLSAFTNYQSSINSITTNQEANLILNKIKSSLYDLKNSDSGSKEVDLPAEIGGIGYELSINDGLKVFRSGEEFSRGLTNFNSYNMEGKVEGGSVVLEKTGRNYTMRTE